MPFQFRDRDGRSIDLNQIDEEMCRAYGEIPNEKYFSTLLQTALEMAVVLSLENGGLTETLLNEKLKMQPQYKEILKDFFVKRYVFTVWPEGK